MKKLNKQKRYGCLKYGKYEDIWNISLLIFMTHKIKRSQIVCSC